MLGQSSPQHDNNGDDDGGGGYSDDGGDDDDHGNRFKPNVMSVESITRSDLPLD